MRSSALGLIVALAAWGIAGCAAGPVDRTYLPPARIAAAQPQPTGRVLRVPEQFPTVQAAIDAAAGGDTVLLAPGRYPGGVRIAGKAVTLASHYLTTGERRFIEQTVIEVEGGNWVLLIEADAGPALGQAGPETRVIGLTLRGGGDGIRCLARCQVLDNRILGSGDGIDYEGGGGLCRGNLFEGCRDDAIDLDGDCDVVIEDNVIRGSRDDGIEARCYEYRARTRLQIVIRGNLIADSGEDGIQIIDHRGPSNRVLWIERNVIRDSAMAAVGCMDHADTREDYRAAAIPDPVFLINNTLLDNRYGLSGGGDLVVANNVFARTASSAVKGPGRDAVLTHNLFWANGRDAEDAKLPADSAVRRDPLLGADDVPGEASPCVDAGTAEIRGADGRLLVKLPADSYAGGAPDLGARDRPAPRLPMP